MLTVPERFPTMAAAVSGVMDDRQSLADDGARPGMGLLARHFRRPVAVGNIIDHYRIEAAVLADTLDGIVAAMFIVDGIARILHINASGYALLTDAAVLRCVSGRLSVIDRQAERTLRAAIAAARADDAPVDVRGVTVPLAAYDGKQWLAHVLPLNHARRQINTAYTAVAAVFIRKVGLDLAYALATLASVYNLTPAEMRVLAAMVEFGGVPEVASVLGISETTVKTHLQHIFEKTGTNRQADLVKLVAGFASPLR